MFEQAREVDVEQLVPVQREDVARLLALTRRKADTPSSPEPLGLLGDRDFDAEAAESGRELLTSSGAATDDYTASGRPATDTSGFGSPPPASPRRSALPPARMIASTG